MIIEKENLKCERGENLILLPFKNLVKVCWHSILVISRKKLSNHIVLIFQSNQIDFAEKKLLNHNVLILLSNQSDFAEKIVIFAHFFMIADWKAEMNPDQKK